MCAWMGFRRLDGLQVGLLSALLVEHLHAIQRAYPPQRTLLIQVRQMSPPHMADPVINNLMM